MKNPQWQQQMTRNSNILLLLHKQHSKKSNKSNYKYANKKSSLKHLILITLSKSSTSKSHKWTLFTVSLMIKHSIISIKHSILLSTLLIFKKIIFSTISSLFIKSYKSPKELWRKSHRGKILKVSLLNLYAIILQKIPTSSKILLYSKEYIILSKRKDKTKRNKAKELWVHLLKDCSPW